MDDFLNFIDYLVKRFPVHVEIYYSKICDWCITVTKKGCAEDFPDSESVGNDALLCREQDCDIQLCFAKAHVAVKEWLLEHERGY